MLPILLFGISILIFGMMQLLTPYERVSLYVSDIPKKTGVPTYTTCCPTVIIMNFT